jgi:hypothetical protein
VIEKLNAGFVSTWVLRNDMIHYAGPEGGKPAGPIPAPRPDEKKRAAVSEAVRAFAREVRAHYTYPVDSLLFDADGKFLSDLAASDLLMEFPGDKKYVEFLSKAAPPGGK